ncbi:uncharacterized protein [Branchiostoma lanceolatum]|uniref:uncharacterized protein n=1 Tax=Branchiostoma lanceolatum TaxID=7740 RepID=UPI00345553C3
MAEFKMAGASGDRPMSLENFVRSHQLPAIVRVTEGIYSTDVISDFSLGDVIKILPPKRQSRPRGYDPDGDAPPFDVVDIVIEGTGEVKTHSVYSDLFIIPVHSVESTAFQPPMSLRELLRKRGAVFPVDVVVTEGRFKSDNARLKVGSQLVVYMGKTVKVVLAERGDTKIAIRDAYQGRFRVKPKRYLSASDLYSSAIDREVRVLRSPKIPLGRLDNISIDDILIPTNVVGKTPSTSSSEVQEDFLLCMRKDRTTGDEIPIRIPLFADCLFEECLDATFTHDGQSSGYTIVEVVRMSPELPVNVELVRSDPTFPDDHLSTIGTISVRGEYSDTYLVARERKRTDKTTTAFEMPTHADVKVKLCQRNDHVVSKVVAQHQVIEFLPVDVFNEKLTNVTTYESILTPPPLPPRPSNLPHFSTSTGNRTGSPSNDPPEQAIPAVPLRRTSLQRARRPPSNDKSWRQTFHPDSGHLDRYHPRSRPLSESDTHLSQWGSKTLPAQTTFTTLTRAKDGSNAFVRSMSRMFGAVTRKVEEAKTHLRHSKD